MEIHIYEYGKATETALVGPNMGRAGSQVITRVRQQCLPVDGDSDMAPAYTSQGGLSKETISSANTSLVRKLSLQPLP